MSLGAPWTQEEVAAFDLAYSECGGQDWAVIAEAVPTRTPKAVRSRVERYNRAAAAKAQTGADLFAEGPKATVPTPALGPEIPVEREFESDGDTARITTKGLAEEVQTLDDLVRVCRIDTAQWSVARYTQKAYTGFHKTGAKGQEVAVKVQLFSVTAHLKAKKLVLAARGELDAILAEIRSGSTFLTPPLRVVQSRPSSGLMLELCIADHHIGKLAWHRECGQAYDVAIARRLYWEAVEDILGKVAGYGRFDRIAFVVGNDFLNANNIENQTGRGTPQTTDGRQPRTFRIARQLVTEVIQERLRGVADRVDVVMVGGNHDPEANFYLGEVLDAYFHAAPDVVVDNSPTQRKYVRHGQNLLGFTHGSEEKHAELRDIMATERRRDWGDTLFREWHVGHLHGRKSVRYQAKGAVEVEENFGVVVRTLPSMCAAEDWHTSKGYIGNVRCAEGYVWDASSGMAGTAVYNVPDYTDPESLLGRRAA